MGLITIKEAADILERPQRTIRDWIDNDVIKGHKVKSMLYVDSNTVFALKDTEADIDHAIEQRQKFLEKVKEEIKEWEEIFGNCPYYKLGVLVDILTTYSDGVLNYREKMIFFDVLRGSYMKGIGEKLGLTTSRVQQIFAKASHKLQASASSYVQMSNEKAALIEDVEQLKQELAKNKVLIDDYRNRLNVSQKQIEAEDDGILSKSISDCNLSVRALNCLKCADIDTVYKLTQVRREALLQFRNIGRKTLNELEDFLYSIGRTWGDKWIVPVYSEKGSWITGYELSDKRQ